jgi:hypothetical protein
MVAMDATVERIYKLKKKIKEAEKSLNDLPSNDHPLYISMSEEITYYRVNLAAEYRLLHAYFSPPGDSCVFRCLLIPRNS